MSLASWSTHLSQVHSSYLVLIFLAVTAVVGGLLFYFGVIDRTLWILGFLVRGAIRRGFLLWERLLSWAPWPLFLLIVVGFLVLGAGFGNLWPGLKVICGAVPLFLGATACLAYMLIDLERYEVQRGYKAIHNPMKGQELAVHLTHYGHQVGVPLLVAATVGMIGGFALFSEGLYETIGADWYRPGDGQGTLIFADFLAYVFLSLLGIVDVLDLAQAHDFLRVPYVHTTHWVPTALTTGFRAFFTLILLQQIFASVRQGKLLAETIADFWSPHEPIHKRARHALPQFGRVAIGALLASLRDVPALTKEQREQLPLIVTSIGPSTIPTLLHHLHDPHEHLRAVVVAALGRLHALNAIPALAALANDSSEIVRQTLMEALGTLGSVEAQFRHQRGPRRHFRSGQPSVGRLFAWMKRGTPAPAHHSDELVVTTLITALSDESTAVRAQAAAALGQIGAAAAAAAPALILLLKDNDESVRCQAAEALSQVGGDEGATVAALADLLQDASGTVKATAARALGALKAAAAPAALALIPLLQDRDEAVRTAATEALARIGPLNHETTENLVEGLTSPDNVVRAQTAEALGAIGPAAEDAAGALVAAMKDGNGLVRARAVEALGKIGESAAPAAVSGLVRALRDQDNWVSALAAEALGQMGESADGAVPALVYSLRHVNPQVRANAAAALGKMGPAAAIARLALEKATRDEDGGVRSQAVRGLGALGPATATSTEVIVAGLQDADPLVRAAAVECMGQWTEVSEAALAHLLALLDDANDQVKVETTKVLPKLAGATPAVIEALCRRLLEDDSAWVQVHAALALGKLGPAAAAAGGALFQVVQTGELSVRDQAMRAIAMIQPPETLAAFTVGMKDADGDIRKVASGGWMKAPSIPEEVVPLLIVALRDPELQVRANAANALARLDTLPAEAVPLLLDCATDPSDGLRINAALALKRADPRATGEVMQHLLQDGNIRIRLIAASSILTADPTDARAGAALLEALNDPTPRTRKAALELIESLGAGGEVFRSGLNRRGELEEEADLREVVARLLAKLGNPAPAELQPAVN